MSKNVNDSELRADENLEQAAETTESVLDDLVTTAPNPEGTRKSKQRNLARGNAIAGFLFVLPFIIGFLAFLAYPLFQSIRMSMSSVNVKSFTFTHIGIFNKNSNYYYIFFRDSKFIEKAVDELKRVALFVPGILVFSFFMAVLLNQEFKGRALVRSIYFLPVILAAGAFLGLESNNPLISNVKDMVKAENGAAAITKTLENILLSGETGNTFFQYVIDLVGRVYDIAMSSGIQIIVFLSGLQTIPPSMYEAAKMEGCTAWESFWKITFPLIGSMIMVNIVYTMVDFFTRTDSQLMDYISYVMTTEFNYGRVAAMSWAYFLVVGLFLALVFAIFSRRVYYYD